MIALLKGNIISKSSQSVIVDVNGVGYEVYTPVSTYSLLSEGETNVSLFIYTAMRENSLMLYGFLTPEEKSLFKLLISVTGIGPKAGVNILSGINSTDFAEAILKDDLTKITSLPGIGKKTAERLIVELKDKVSAFLSTDSDIAGKSISSVHLNDIEKDVVSALLNLGYKIMEAEKAVVKHREKTEDFENLFKHSLKELSKK